jgi:LPXTG-motif cell wall-anchored protein
MSAERERPQGIERDIQNIRGDLDALLGELDRRRHAAFDWRAQTRRHRGSLLLAAGALGVAAGGYVLVRRRRRRHRRFATALELAHALRVVAEKPERLTRAVERDGRGSAALRIARIAAPIVARSLLKPRGSRA